MKLTLGWISLIAIFLVLLLSNVQRPTQEQLNQSVLQGQHQSEANYWRGN